MSWLNLDFVSGSTRLRSTLRRAGVTQALSSLRPFIGASDYEAKVDQALTSLVRPGDCVWDVGANVGLYTTRFATAVGPKGKVIAFEPIATTHAELSSRVSALDNVQTHQFALGASKSAITLALHEDPTSPTNSLMHAPSGGAERTQQVDIVAGDELILEQGVLTPSVIKIDTEGFEEDVLWGLRQTLRSPSLRGILVEVHFALLEARGYRRAPERLSSLLDDAGFRTRWVDPSHLLAERNA